MTAIDPRPGVQLAYVATTEATVQSATNGPTAKCITGKRIRVFQSPDLGATWSDMPGSDLLPQGLWATDPDISVGGDGTVYLTLLLTTSYANCATAPTFETDGLDVQLWVAAPGGALHPAFASGSPFATVLSRPNADFPQIAASPTRPGQVVLSWVDRPADQVVTFQRNAAGFYDEVNRFPLSASARFPNLSLDMSGDLYVSSNEPRVQRFSWTGSAWTLITDGFPPILGTYVHTGPDLALPSSQSASVAANPSIAMAVTRINGASDHIVYLAFEVNINGQRRIELAAANTLNLIDGWAPPTLAPLPGGSLMAFHPSLSADAQNNLLDLLVYDIQGTSGGPLTGLFVKTFFYRYDASHLTPDLGPTQVGLNPPAISDLPARHSDKPPSLFAGEYVGLASKGLTAVTAYPEWNSGTANVDLGRAQITQSCEQALALVDPDNLWECTCSCSPGEFNFVSIVGCASNSATTPGAACAQVCSGSICGGALACGSGACQGTTTGQRLSTGSCAVSDGPAAGAPPASTGDFRAANDGTSNAVLHFGSQSSTTSLPGAVFMNVSTSPPTAGAVAEIPRLSVAPADVFVGGEINATVRNIKVVHRSRLRALFTDGTHFRLDPGMAEFILTVQTDPGEGELSAPVNLRVSNPTPIAGVLNLAANTFSIDGTVGDGAGNFMDIHFHGTISSRPPDSDGDGVIDVVDKCGTNVGPDRVAPVFTFVPPAVTISSCSDVNIGQATATDPCGVTVTSDKPSTFPLGTTTVTWKATDGAGNTTVAKQKVTAVLGDSASCCPAGTHVVVGTSNNDNITGTSGADCIIALGGQDAINGGGGNDFISGGDGNDVINGGTGDDRLYGGTGQDTMSGGAGNDFLDGGDGVDQVNGDDGADTIEGGQGGDILRGGIGNDLINGGADDDQIFGGDGNDVISGGDGNDTLNGENGNDVIGGGSGDDNLNGGSGTNALDGGGGHNTCIDNGATLLECEGEGH